VHLVRIYIPLGHQKRIPPYKNNKNQKPKPNKDETKQMLGQLACCMR